MAAPTDFKLMPFGKPPRRNYTDLNPPLRIPPLKAKLVALWQTIQSTRDPELIQQIRTTILRALPDLRYLPNTEYPGLRALLRKGELLSVEEKVQASVEARHLWPDLEFTDYWLATDPDKAGMRIIKFSLLAYGFSLPFEMLRPFLFEMSHRLFWFECPESEWKREPAYADLTKEVVEHVRRILPKEVKDLNYSFVDEAEIIAVLDCLEDMDEFCLVVEAEALEIREQLKFKYWKSIMLGQGGVLVSRLGRVSIQLYEKKVEETAPLGLWDDMIWKLGKLISEIGGVMDEGSEALV